MEAREGTRVGMNHEEAPGSVSAPLKGVVFDLDDTLYLMRDYDLSGLRAVCAFAAARLGYDYGACLPALCRRYEETGRVTPRLFEGFAREFGKPAGDARAFAEVFRIHEPDIRAVGGAVPMLEVLRFRYKVGIMASGYADTALLKFKALGFSGRFDALHPRVPHGAPWTRKAVLEWFEREFAAEPGEMAYVGASSSGGFDAARARGWHTVFVTRLPEGGRVVEIPRSALSTVDDILDVEKLLPALTSLKGDERPGEAAGAGPGGRAWKGLQAALTPASVL